MGEVRVCREGTSYELWELQFLPSIAFFSLHPDFLGTHPDSQHVQRCMVWLVSHEQSQLPLNIHLTSIQKPLRGCT